jgi:hypothetical protein
MNRRKAGKTIVRCNLAVAADNSTTLNFPTDNFDSVGTPYVVKGWKYTADKKLNLYDMWRRVYEEVFGAVSGISLLLGYFPMQMCLSVVLVAFIFVCTCIFVCS